PVPQPPVPVPPRAGPGRGLHRPAQPLLDLRQPGSGRAAPGDARARTEPPVAGRPRSAHRSARDGRDRDPRLLRAAQGLAGRAEPRKDVWVVVVSPFPCRRAAGAAGPSRTSETHSFRRTSTSTRTRDVLVLVHVTRTRPIDPAPERSP